MRPLFTCVAIGFLGLLATGCASGSNETGRSAHSDTSSSRASSGKGSSDGAASAKSERKAPSAARSKASKNIKEAIEMSPAEERGRLAAQGLSEVDEYPLGARQREALSLTAGPSLDPSQCETVLAATVAELDAKLVEGPCGDRASMMKALASGSLEERIGIAGERCKVRLDPQERALVTPMGVVMSAIVRAQFEADGATSDDERSFAGHLTRLCRR